MYKEMYDRWLAADLADADLKPELESVKDDDAAIQDRFAVALKFGTAGLRGVLGAGTNRMNIYVVRQATQGLANWVKTQGGSQTGRHQLRQPYQQRRVRQDRRRACWPPTASRCASTDALMPVPALSFATRYYKCNAGIMVTASHNPAKYNGYKAYGPDGCQMTDEAADIVYAEIQKTDILTGAKVMSFEDGIGQGLIEYVGDDCMEALYSAIEARSRPPRHLQDRRPEAGILPAERLRPGAGHPCAEGHRHHRRHHRTRAAVSGRQLPHLPVPQPGDLRGPAPGPGAGQEDRR